jgi:glycosyltransferase involved in cell wall biosynthesis
MDVGIDVLICAYNEAAHVARTLESLRAQSVGAENFRIILVDNASKDDTRKVVEENSQGLNLEYVYEELPGLNIARNTGYRHARAPYVAHLDADAKADPRWLETIQEVIRQQQPDLCGGPFFPYYIGEKPAWFLDKYNSSYKGDEARVLGEQEFLNGTNMIWRRSLVEQLGGFAGGVGLVARGFTRGDETQLILRARRELPSFKAFYHPKIIVYHLTRDEWFSLKYWLRCSFAQGLHDHELWDTPAHQRSRYLRLGQFVFGATKIGIKGAMAVVTRDKNAFPYWENYWYERVIPEVYRLGGVWRLTRQPGKVSSGPV